jgi:hypothetical protein
MYVHVGMSVDDAELDNIGAYETEFEGAKYQVEVLGPGLCTPLLNLSVENRTPLVSTIHSVKPVHVLLTTDH